MEKYLSLILSALGSFAVVLFGAWDAPIQMLILAILIDYITGVFRSIIKKDLNSSVGFKGIIKKLLILTVAAASNIIDVMTGGAMLIRTIVINVLAANELLSIIENAGECGVPIPKSLRNAIAKLKEQDNDKDTKSKAAVKSCKGSK